MKDKVLVVVPTTASRLQLVKEVLDKLYSNSNLNIKTIIVKNGTYSNDEYESFKSRSYSSIFDFSLF